MKKLKSLCIVMLLAVLIATGFVDVSMVRASGGWPPFKIGINEEENIGCLFSPSIYNFSSSNSAVATVSNKGIVTGISYGKVVITATPKSKYRYFLVDDEIKVKRPKEKVTIIVSKPKRNSKKELYYQPGFYENAYQNNTPQNVAGLFLMECLNPKAKYTYSTTSKLIKIKPDGTIQQIRGAGVVEIVVTENYQEKKTQVGKYKLKIKDIRDRKYSESECEIGENWHDYDFEIGIIWDYYQVAAKGNSIYVLSDEKIEDQEDFEQKVHPEIPGADEDQSERVLKYVYDKKGKWEGDLIANKIGSTYVVEAYYNYITGKYVFVHCEKVTVPDRSKTKKVFLNESEWKDHDIGKGKGSAITLFENRAFSCDICTEEGRYTGYLNASSSNPEVVNVSCSGNDLLVQTLGPGKATITIEADGASANYEVEVKSLDFTDNCEISISGFFFVERDGSWWEDDLDNWVDVKKSFSMKSSNTKVAKISEISLERAGNNAVIWSAEIDTWKVGETVITVKYNGQVIMEKKIATHS